MIHFKNTDSKDFASIVKGANRCYVFFKKLDLQLYVLKWSLYRLKNRKIPLEIHTKEIEGTNSYTLFIVF